MQLPATVTRYFEADTANEIDAVIETFAANAIVKDEGRIHQGHDAIRSWWRDAKDKYHHVAQPLSSIEDSESVTVRAKVSGDFPNSPAKLKFMFAMAEGKIEKLEIG